MCRAGSHIAPPGLRGALKAGAVRARVAVGHPWVRSVRMSGGITPVGVAPVGHCCPTLIFVVYSRVPRSLATGDLTRCANELERLSAALAWPSAAEEEEDADGGKLCEPESSHPRLNESCRLRRVLCPLRFKVSPEGDIRNQELFNFRRINSK